MIQQDSKTDEKIISSVKIPLTHEQAYALLESWEVEDKMLALQSKNLAEMIRNINQ